MSASGASRAAEREAMVERQLRRRGIDDERVLAAMGEVPREEFVPAELRDRAYRDSALPIGHGQTISQPWVVAAICQALRLQGGETVLDVGSGSGYSSAVLSRLAARVVAAELLPELAESSVAALSRAGAVNVEVVTGDASAGLPGRGPFDAIAVHAVAPELPQDLAAQLRPAGRLVAPIAQRGADMLTAFARTDDGTGTPRFEAEAIAPCRFVPLLGPGGFDG